MSFNSISRLVFIVFFFSVTNAPAQTDSIQGTRVTVGIDVVKFLFHDYEIQIEYRDLSKEFFGIAFGYDKNSLDRGRQAIEPYHRGETNWWGWGSRLFWGEGFAGRAWWGIRNVSLELVVKNRRYSNYAYSEKNSNETFAEDGKSLLMGVTVNFRQEIAINRTYISPFLGFGVVTLTSQVKRPAYFYDYQFHPADKFTAAEVWPAINFGVTVKYAFIQKWKKVYAEERKYNPQKRKYNPRERKYKKRLEKYASEKDTTPKQLKPLSDNAISYQPWAYSGVAYEHVWDLKGINLCSGIGVNKFGRDNIHNSATLPVKGSVLIGKRYSRLEAGQIWVLPVSFDEWSLFGWLAYRYQSGRPGLFFNAGFMFKEAEFNYVDIDSFIPVINIGIGF
jgi:hypothetical protein